MRGKGGDGDGDGGGGGTGKRYYLFCVPEVIDPNLASFFTPKLRNIPPAYHFDKIQWFVP